MSVLIANPPSSTLFTAPDYLAMYSTSMPALSTFVPPNIRVPPPLPIPEIPLRERRGFVEFIPITPRSVLGDTAQSVPMPAKGHLEPKAGALPRRRRRVPPSNTHTTNQNVDPESKKFDL
ncbi:hypothetical protein EV360DRAFT_69360 [Lentinula raphanica]|nr:hypothetical protein EV360DRAFT_69360 [Lentinula raphanica]